MGGVLSFGGTEVRLVREELRITLVDTEGYEVEARYQLHNSGRKHTLRYGIPLRWIVPERGDPQADLTTAAEARTAAASVQLRIGGRLTECALVNALEPPVAKREWATPGSDAPTLDEGGSNEPPWRAIPAHRIYSDDEPLWHRTHRIWCVADIDVPEGPSELVLTHAGTLAFLDLQVKSQTRFSMRELAYDLHPAGHGSGHAEEVVIRLDPGPYGRRVSASLSGPRWEAGQRVWRLKDIDLTQVPALSVRFTLSEQQLLHHWVRHYAPFPRGAVPLTSSEAPELVDGDLKTLWCPTSKTPAKIRFQRDALKINDPGYWAGGSGAPLCGDAKLLVVTGGVADQVRTLRLGRCGSTPSTVEIPAGGLDEASHSVVLGTLKVQHPELASGGSETTRHYVPTRTEPWVTDALDGLTHWKPDRASDEVCWEVAVDPLEPCLAELTITCW